MTVWFRRFGFVYILLVMFLGSWLGQYVATVHESGSFSWAAFWSSTFENWQSEFLQLFVQALGMYIVTDMIFRKANEDLERIERKINMLLECTDGR